MSARYATRRPFTVAAATYIRHGRDPLIVDGSLEAGPKRLLVSRVIRYWRDCPVTWVLLVAFTATFLLQLALAGLIGLERSNNVFYFGPDWTEKPWTIVLSHLGHQPDLWYHFPVNMVGAALLMPAAERAAGRALFLTAYWTAAILGSFLKLNLIGAESVGASAGILGIFGYFLNAMLMPGALALPRKHMMRYLLLAPSFMLLFLSMNVAVVRQLGHASHWYGFAMGGLFALVHAIGMLSLRRHTTGRPPAAAPKAY